MRRANGVLGAGCSRTCSLMSSPPMMNLLDADLQVVVERPFGLLQRAERLAVVDQGAVLGAERGDQVVLERKDLERCRHAVLEFLLLRLDLLSLQLDVLLGRLDP